MKKTVIAGATTNPSRYAYLAASMLKNHAIPFVPLGIKNGEVFGEGIQDIREKPPIADVHTITMYMSARHQEDYHEYFLSLNPKRIIFNPGAENDELAEMAREKGIEIEEACTLVMIRIGAF